MAQLNLGHVKGATGPGVPAGGTSGQVLRKNSATDYDTVWATLLDLLHPVDSLYWSFSAADPGTLFGGTWERIKDRFLLAAGDVYPAGSAGGSATAAIGLANLPALDLPTNAAGSAFGVTGISTAVNATGINVSAAGAYYNNAEYTPVKAKLAGSATPLSTLPPHQAVYAWRRTA